MLIKLVPNHKEAVQYMLLPQYSYDWKMIHSFRSTTARHQLDCVTLWDPTVCYWVPCEMDIREQRVAPENRSGLP